MNATGAQILAFYKAWPMGDDWYHEDGFINSEEDHNLDLQVEYDLDDAIGTLLWQGEGKPPSHIQINGHRVGTDRDDEFLDLVAAFKAWQGDDVVVIIQLPPGEVEALEKVCAERGWSKL